MMNKKDIDWDNLGFYAHETKSMFKAVYTPGKKWQVEGLIPYGNVSMSPASTVLNYGQGVFEGTKAYRTSKNRVAGFRIEDNAARFESSSERLCIPPLPKGLFLNAIQEVVKDNSEFLPSQNQGSLYIRPLAYGDGPMLGVKASNNYTFLIYATPVGSYFKSGLKRLDTILTEKYHRVATKSIGFAKAVGNYAGTLLPYKESTEQGFDEIIFLNSSDENIIDEARSANIFVLKGNVLKTPVLQGSILPGITRDSVIKVARELFDLEVHEQDVTIEDLLSGDEVFFTGTAAVIAPAGSINYKGNTVQFEIDYNVSVTKKIREKLIDIQYENIEDPFGWVVPLD
jgi:branched-chain amino acid aminotransferase|tara:strand:- start:1338 stop:2363 length:1026 start_codon:yes stop_codon:yes gene_type:complete